MFNILTKIVAVCGNTGGESFVWLSRQQLYVLVYLVTVMHSAQAGYMDKAHKYTEKALAQIDKLTCEYGMASYISLLLHL